MDLHRQSRWRLTTAKEIGAAGYYVLDTGKTDYIPAFVKEITSDHPELDCLINNAGVQRPIEVLKNDDFLEKADQEIDINIRGPMHLALHLIPHFKQKPNALIMNVSATPNKAAGSSFVQVKAPKNPAQINSQFLCSLSITIRNVG